MLAKLDWQITHWKQVQNEPCLPGKKALSIGERCTWAIVMIEKAAFKCKCTDDWIRGWRSGFDFYILTCALSDQSAFVPNLQMENVRVILSINLPFIMVTAIYIYSAVEKNNAQICFCVVKGIVPAHPQDPEGALMTMLNSCCQADPNHSEDCDVGPYFTHLARLSRVILLAKWVKLPV